MRLLKRRELWVPTWSGWFFIVIATVAIAAGYTRYIHSFLSISKPVPARILAVEEWIHPLALECAASEFKGHGYSLLAVLGDDRRWVVPILAGAGVDKKQIVKIPVRPVPRDRTFAMAVALKNWLLSPGTSDKAVNVYTLGVHARRSRLLFREALGPDYKVGVISCEDPDYDPDRWWASTAGFKTVIDETLAYVYTELFFFPARSLNRFVFGLNPKSIEPDRS